MYGWRDQPDHGGGCSLDWGIHAGSNAIPYPGAVISVTAVIKNITTELFVDDYAKVILNFESGLSAHVEVATFIEQKLPRWSIFCLDGNLQISEISSQYASLVKIKDAHYERMNFLRTPRMELKQEPRSTWFSKKKNNIGY